MNKTPTFFALISTALIFWPSGTAEANLEQLMKSLKTMPGLEADYQETKHIEFLVMPLVSEGRLRFLPPDQLARDTLKPFKSRTLIIANRLIVEEGTKTKEIDVGSNPVVRGFIQSFVMLLAGDLSGLKKLYALKFTEKNGAWILILEPKASSVKNLIKRISLKGSGTVLQSMRIDEASGDYSVSICSKVNPQRKYTADEIGKYFKISN
jgi:outer membrane lipoprotein carrier protein